MDTKSMNDLHVTLIQSDISWEDPGKNIGHFSAVFGLIPGKPGLVVLPEMFSTGFSVNPGKCAETTGGPAMQFMKETSAAGGMVVTGSILTSENGRFYNRLIWMRPDGIYSQYDKRHLFRLSEEYKVMTAGRTKTILNLEGWNILPLVCYDLRFPAWSRNSWNDGLYEYDVLLYAANWPASRANIWQSLLIARAIENQCYVIGVNRVGKDGHGTAHGGNSMVVNPDGTILAAASADEPEVLQSVLSMDKLSEFRKKYPFAPDWDHLTIQI